LLLVGTFLVLKVMLQELPLNHPDALPLVAEVANITGQHLYEVTGIEVVPADGLPALPANESVTHVWHGVNAGVERIQPIVEQGFSAATIVEQDYGYMKRGIYSTPRADLALAICSKWFNNNTTTALLYCDVALGRTERCADRIQDQGVIDETQYDSRVTEDGDEMIVADAGRIVPRYVVHVRRANGSIHKEGTFVDNALHSKLYEMRNADTAPEWVLVETRVDNIE